MAIASAAKNASTIESTTTATAITMLFFTEAQKCARWIASVKFEIVGCHGNQTGGSEKMSWPRLNPVATIQ